MTRDWPLAVVLSVTTGRSTCAFSDTHELAEFLTGGPIWTHEFALPEVWSGLRAEIVRQVPQLADVTMPADLAGPSVLAWVTVVSNERGMTDVPLVGGGAPHPTKDPLTTLREVVGPDKPIVVMATDELPEGVARLASC